MIIQDRYYTDSEQELIKESIITQIGILEILAKVTGDESKRTCVKIHRLNGILESLDEMEGNV